MVRDTLRAQMTSNQPYNKKSALVYQDNKLVQHPRIHVDFDELYPGRRRRKHRRKKNANEDTRKTPVSRTANVESMETALSYSFDFNAKKSGGDIENEQGVVADQHSLQGKELAWLKQPPNAQAESDVLSHMVTANVPTVPTFNAAITSPPPNNQDFRQISLVGRASAPPNVIAPYENKVHMTSPLSEGHPRPLSEFVTQNEISSSRVVK